MLRLNHLSWIITSSIIVLLTLSLLTATCHLLITFSNSLNPDQDRQTVGPDLDPNCLTLYSVPVKMFLKVNFEKSQQLTTKS